MLHYRVLSWSLADSSRASEARAKPERGLGSIKNYVHMLLIGPKMAGQIELKLGGMDEGIERTSSRRNFF